MPRLTIQTFGQDEFDARIKDIDDFGKNGELQELWNDLTPIVAGNEETIFNAEGAVPGYIEWLGLSDKYAKRKAKKYPGGSVMVASGALRDFESSPDSLKSIQSMSDYTTQWDMGLVFDTFPYAHRHQAGTFGMPRREHFHLFGDRKTGTIAEIGRAIANFIHLHIGENWAKNRSKKFLALKKDLMGQGYSGADLDMLIGQAKVEGMSF